MQDAPLRAKSPNRNVSNSQTQGLNAKNDNFALQHKDKSLILSHFAAAGPRPETQLGDESLRSKVKSLRSKVESLKFKAYKYAH